MKTKIFLTADEIAERKVTCLITKYKVSRATIFLALKRGWFWEDFSSINESICLHWVEENITEINSVVKDAAWFKFRRKGVIGHRLFGFFQKDIIEEGILYVIKRSGEIESGKSKLINIACSGLDHAIDTYFRYRDGGNTVGKLDFFDDESFYAAEVEEGGIDQIFLQVKEEITSSVGEETWDELWRWALSRKTKCPEKIQAKLREVVL